MPIKTKVVSIGSDAYFEDYALLVLFNTECPDELKDACILHEYIDTPTDNIFTEGATVRFGSKEYTVEKVGAVANQNMKALGHVSLNFNPDLDMMPGSILLRPYEIPTLQQGDVISIG